MFQFFSVDILLDMNYEIKIEKAIEQELGSKFIEIDHDKEDIDTFRAINETFRHIKH